MLAVDPRDAGEAARLAALLKAFGLPRAILHGPNPALGSGAARIHFPDTPLREPVTAYFQGNGVVVCKRVPAAVERGDCLFHLAENSGDGSIS